jgi:hypothetical protein
MQGRAAFWIMGCGMNTPSDGAISGQRYIEDQIASRMALESRIKALEAKVNALEVTLKLVHDYSEVYLCGLNLIRNLGIELHQMQIISIKTVEAAARLMRSICEERL